MYVTWQMHIADPLLYSADSGSWDAHQLQVWFETGHQMLCLQRMTTCSEIAFTYSSDAMIRQAAFMTESCHE
jgi:hypothetical protein